MNSIILPSKNKANYKGLGLKFDPSDTEKKIYFKCTNNKCKGAKKFQETYFNTQEGDVIPLIIGMSIDSKSCPCCGNYSLIIS